MARHVAFFAVGGGQAISLWQAIIVVVALLVITIVALWLAGKIECSERGCRKRSVKRHRLARMRWSPDRRR